MSFYEYLSTVNISFIRVVFLYIIWSFFRNSDRKKMSKMRGGKTSRPRQESPGFLCSSTGEIIDLEKVGDGSADCQDASDELAGSIQMIRSTNLKSHVMTGSDEEDNVPRPRKIFMAAQPQQQSSSAQDTSLSTKVIAHLLNRHYVRHESHLLRNLMKKLSIGKKTNNNFKY